MPVLIGIALKSLLIAGLTLGLLQFMKARSPAERSCVAHLGLVALIVMAVAPLILPNWVIDIPAFSDTLAVKAPVPTNPVIGSAAIAPAHSTRIFSATVPVIPKVSTLTMVIATYALPAAMLLCLTLLAWLRLIALHARADVVVDAHWLGALARAQRRMGFKHGTALLTSNDLASPISWGLMRPVILLSHRAAEASSEAEAIIAHELAHVARMDWVKLLLARVATALFWFNPLVWILAREAHQLREEAADDSVLAADITDTDYAQLLVGVARHECPGLLLGAHGVAPSKGSLARRVARVLDAKLVRRPAAKPFALGVFVGAIAIATPLAALTITTGSVDRPRTYVGKRPLTIAGQQVADATAVPTDLPRIIARGVSASVATATAAIASPAPLPIAPAVAVATASAAAPATVVRNRDGATVTIYPPDANGRRKTVARSASGAVAIAYADDTDDDFRATKDNDRPHDRAIETAIEMKSLGITPEYVAAIRSASPALRDADLEDIVGLRAVGVTPDYAREIASAGLANADAEDLKQLRAVGVTTDYVRAIRATGVQANADELVELKSMGVRPDELARIRASGALTKRKLRQIVAPPPDPDHPGD